MPAPSYDVDFYSDAFIRDPWPHYAAMRELGPLVWLPQHGNYALTRHREIGECLRDPDTFCSGRGVAADKKACEMMQGNSIASDGERHNAIRFAMAGPLLPGALEGVRPLIEALAQDLIERLVEQGRFDAMGDLASHLPLTVVRDLVGLPDFGKDNMLRWGGAAFDLLGIQNARGRDALETFLEQRDFIRRHATREALKEGSWTRRIHELVDDGALSPELAPFCIRDYINPSLDTTISATGQLIWQLAQNPDQWDLLRERPELAINAVNEAVRLGAPIRSFSRHATREVRYGRHAVEAGARVMVLYASANRDERAFPDPERFDVTRSPKAHLGFGSGIHMCVGMHLAQLEMVALLDAMIPRVRRIRTGDATMALNNTIYSFASLPAEFEAAPKHARSVAAAEARTAKMQPAALLRAQVLERREVAEGIVCLTIAAADGSPLPGWEPGAHVDVHVHPGLVRQYSLTGAPEPGLYRIAVQQDSASSGGSIAMHRKYQAGSQILIGRPRNNFPLAETAPDSLLFSAGIGLTPMLAMAWRLHERGRSFAWHVSARNRARLPFGGELDALPFADRIVLHLDDDPTRPALQPDAVLGRASESTHVYVCGPRGYMAAIQDSARRAGIGADRFHQEHFGAEIDVAGDAFAVEAVRSGCRIEVGSNETILAALERGGIHVETACRNGVCGSCLTGVIEGRPDHRDMVLTDAEKAANDRIAVCCSRSKTRVLRLDL